MSTVYASGNAVSVSTSEISLISGTTTLQTRTDAGIYELVLSLTDFSFTKDDLFELTVMEKCLAGSAMRVLDRVLLGRLESGTLLLPNLGLIHGWDIRLKSLANTRNASWAIRKVGGCTEYKAVSALSVSTTELSLHTGTSTLQSKTDDGVYCMIVDAVEVALAKDDKFRFKVKEKAISAATQGEVHPLTIEGPQWHMQYTPWFGLREGFDHTAIKTNGADATFDVSVRKAA